MQRRTAISAQIPDVYGRRVTAEVTATIEPRAVDGHHVWRAVATYGVKPIMWPVDEPPFNRCPIEKAVGSPIAAGQFQRFGNRRHGDVRLVGSVRGIPRWPRAAPTLISRP